MMPALILIRGAGDLASGVALRLHHAGLNVVMTELAKPLAVRRSVAFAEAIYEGQITVEDLQARRVEDPADTLGVLNILAHRQIAVLIDPDCTAARSLHPLVIVDGRMSKRSPEPLAHHAALYVGLGPGFVAPGGCHAVIETKRGHTLGRVIWEGATLDDSGEPDGDLRRVLRAPIEGILRSDAAIGQHVQSGETIASIGDARIVAPFAGVLRGILRPGLTAQKGMKVGDVDPRDDPRLCELVSDKALAVGGGVLEALLARPEIRSKLWT
jgi:xanthine dehydrogenase accessory factor